MSPSRVIQTSRLPADVKFMISCKRFLLLKKKSKVNNDSKRYNLRFLTFGLYTVATGPFPLINLPENFFILTKSVALGAEELEEPEL